MYCPLTGQPCSHPKNVHLTDILSGQVNHTHICQNCAVLKDAMAKYGGVALQPPKQHIFSLPLATPPASLLPPQYPISYFMKIMQELEAKHQEEEDESVPDEPCPHCGQTLQEFVSTGRLGCPACYQFFKDQLSPIIEQVHEGATGHGTGKRPKVGDKPPKNQRRKTLLNSLEVLQRKMDVLVKDERYEDAAILRDQMNNIRKKLEDQELH